MISNKFIVFLSFVSFIFLFSCSQKESDKSVQAETTLTVEEQPNFSYVAIEHQGPYEDHAMVMHDFKLELEKQQIIPTGPLFIIYYNNPENTPAEELKWEIGVPTAEGTMVKEPLILKQWFYEKIARVFRKGATPLNENIYPIIFKYADETNLIYQGPVAVRILYELKKDSSASLRNTEIWFPIIGTNHIAE